MAHQNKQIIAPVVEPTITTDIHLDFKEKRLPYCYQETDLSETCRKAVKKLLLSQKKGINNLSINLILAKLTSMSSAKARNVVMITGDNH